MNKLEHIKNKVNNDFSNYSYIELMAAKMYITQLLESKKPEHDKKIQAMIEYQKTNPIQSLNDYNKFMEHYHSSNKKCS